MMVIDNKYNIGDFVYLTTDIEQHKRVVTSISVCKGGELVYEVVSGTFTSKHYEFEMSAEENIEMKVR